MVKQLIYSIVLIGLGFGCVGKKKHLQQVFSLKSELNAERVKSQNQLDSLSNLERMLRLELAEKTGENNILILLRTELEDEIESLENQIASLINNANDQEKLLRSKVLSLENEMAKKEDQLEEVSTLITGYNEIFKELTDSLYIYFPIDSVEAISLNSGPFEIGLSFQEEFIFEKSSLLISESGYGVLDTMSDIISSFLRFEMEVQVHSDTENPPRKFEGNWDFTMRRAAVLADFFIGEKGISATRLAASGKADFLPAESNTDEKGRQKNRRITFIIRPQTTSLIREVRQVLSQL